MFCYISEHMEEDVVIATAEPELYLDILKRVEIHMLFERAKLPPPNNNMGDIVHSRRGQVYIFNKEEGLTVRRSRRKIGEVDGLVWKNHGTRDYDNIHVMYSVARKHEGETQFRRTIYWHNIEPFALVHYRGEFKGSIPKESARGRLASAVRNYEKMKATEENPPVRWKYTQGEGNNDNTVFQPASTLPLEDQMRQRAELRPVQGETKFHKAIPFGESRNIKQRIQASVIEAILNETPASQFLNCNTHAIHKPKAGDLFLFEIPTIMKIKWYEHILKDGYIWSSRSVKENNSDTFNTKKFFIKTQSEDGQALISRKLQKMVYYDNHLKRLAIHYSGDSDVLNKAITEEDHAERIIPPVNDYIKKQQKNVAPVIIPLKLAKQLPIFERENVQFIADYMGPDVIRKCYIGENKVKVLLLDQKVVPELRRIMSATQVNNGRLTLHYNSNLQFGDYEVSILSIRHDLLQHISSSRNVVKGLPTLPLGFHIHNHKGRSVNQNYLAEFTTVLDAATNNEFSQREKILVSDKTPPVGTLENAQHIQCWNSILLQMKSKMEELQLSHLYEATSIDTYKLALAKSEEEFKQIFTTAMESNQYIWASEDFKTYYKQHVATVLLESSGRWKLEEMKVPYTQNGITNNSADGLKAVFESCTRKGQTTAQKDVSTLLVACKLYSDNELVKATMAYYNQSPEYKLQNNMVRYALPPTRMPELRQADPVEVCRTAKAVIEKSRHKKLLNQDNNLALGDAEHNDTIENKAKHLFATATFEFVMTENRCQVIDDNYSTFSVKYGQNKSCSCETVGFCEHVIAVDAKMGTAPSFRKPSIRSLPKDVEKPSHPRYSIPKFTGKRKRKPDSIENDEVLQFQTNIENDALQIVKEITPFTRPDLTTDQYEELLLSNEVEVTCIPAHQKFCDMAAFLQELHKETSHKRLDLNSLQNNVLTLELGDVKHIVLSKQNTVSFKCTGQGEVVVFGSLPSKETATFAAKAVQHHKPVDGIILVGHVNTMTPSQDAMAFEKDMDRENVQVWEELKPVCHCRTPTWLEEIPNLTSCGLCQERFHNECLPMQRDEIFVCACCSVTTQGAKWGAGIVKDTCTIDNALTSIVLQCKENLKFCRKVRGYKYNSVQTNSGLRKTLDYAAKEDWAKAQETWNTLRLSRQTQNRPMDTISIAGTPEEQFFNIVKEGGTFRTSVNCTNCGFRERSVLKHELHLDSNVPLENAIQNHLSATMLDTNCKECNNGKLEQQPIANLTGKESWYMNYSTSTTPYLLREVLENAPKNVFLADGAEYKLGMITLAKPGHFTSIIVKDNQFLYYDDIAENRITRVPDDIFAKSFDSIIIHSLTYYWQQSNED